jgi:hypothetical protein
MQGTAIRAREYSTVIVNVINDKIFVSKTVFLQASQLTRYTFYRVTYQKEGQNEKHYKKSLRKKNSESNP